MFCFDPLGVVVVHSYYHREAPMSSLPTGTALHVLQVATGGREFVLVSLGRVQRAITVLQQCAL